MQKKIFLAVLVFLCGCASLSWAATQSGRAEAGQRDDASSSQLITAQEQTEPPATVGEERREEKRKAASAQRVAEVERGGSLLPAYRFVVEPFFEYDHVSGQNVSISGFTVFQAILIGLVQVEKLKRDIYIPGVTLRFGLKNSEFNLRIPYFFREDKVIFPNAPNTALQETHISDNALGDLELYYYYHLLREGYWKPWIPDTILRFGVRFPTGKDPYSLRREPLVPGGVPVPVEFPTGTGHWGMSFGSTFVKSVDPAVIFFNIAYFYNFARFVGEKDVGLAEPLDFGRIALGNTLEYSVGLILAIQERLSINFAFNQRLTGTAHRNGERLVDTSINSMTFNIGATYMASPRWAVDFVVGIGLSQDAPDVSVLVRIPLSFQLGGGVAK